ncbi:hypothetical protein [Amycolatopsis vancoresmycina]|uniref:Uncharacterized protein n=1 Tax=Amycolatopsis vancoresmycina DSM 44592 TaxID=1292037 RepID=R1HTK9_9PSEU|nr:hypothetical protein [Amycolatopsis vancoresmycina]EOD66880.1 hypothetical protein H480_19193 [Amycolatopsis vancoresmycina DSM 44592]
MTDVRQLLDAYAASTPGVFSTLPPIVAMELREAVAPKAFAALRAALDEHKPHQFFSDEPMVCVGCTWDPDDTETHVAYPCRTVQAITTALEAK